MEKSHFLCYTHTHTHTYDYYIIKISSIFFWKNGFNIFLPSFWHIIHCNEFLRIYNNLILFFRGNNSSPIKALEQVRAALQPSLNSEIERVLHSYQEVDKTQWKETIALLFYLENTVYLMQHYILKLNKKLKT